MTRATLLLLLLLAACSDEKPVKQAVNEMIESPLQNTVISSFDTYPPKPVDQLMAPDARIGTLECRQSSSTQDSLRNWPKLGRFPPGFGIATTSKAGLA